MNIQLMENRLKREKAARIESEAILERKSYELYCANEALKESAQQLDAQTEQLHNILDNSAAAVVVTDETGNILRANKMAKRIFGADRVQKNLPLDALISDDQTDLLIELFENGNAGDEPQELQAKNLEGELFPIDAAVARIFVDDVCQTVWICRDITQRKNMEQELRQVQKMEALGELASGVAHEINTPTQFVSDNIRFLQDSFEDMLGLVNSLRDAVSRVDASNKETITSEVEKAIEDADIEFLEEEVPASLEQSLEGMEQIGRIVSAIKEFSHPGIGDKIVIDLNTAIKTTAIVAKNQWKYVSELEMNLAPALPTFLGNAGEINQIVLNLIVNSAHAIEAAKRTDLGKITIETRFSNDFIVLSIEDNGCGIPANDIKKIYDPFFTSKEVGKGTGQGLAITYNIVNNKLGGSITVQSEEGVGTKFDIRIPCKDAKMETNNDS